MIVGRNGPYLISGKTNRKESVGKAVFFPYLKGEWENSKEEQQHWNTSGKSVRLFICKGDLNCLYCGEWELGEQTAVGMGGGAEINAQSEAGEKRK